MMKHFIPSTVFEKTPEEFTSIYRLFTGVIRVHFLKKDLVSFLQSHPEIKRVVDMGCGNAPVTRALLRQFDYLSVRFVDPSSKLLEEAQSLCKSDGISDERVSFVNLNLDDFLKQFPEEKADLVICHAVLSWVEKPFSSLRKLSRLGKQGAFVSLVFGSRIARIAQFAHSGDLKNLCNIIADEDALTESRMKGNYAILLYPQRVLDQLEKDGCTILFKAGVRVLSNFIPSELQTTPEMQEKILSIEELVRYKPEFWQFGRLTHLIYSLPKK